MLDIYRIPNQLPDEKVITVLRRDTFVLFNRTMLFLLLFAILGIAAFIITNFIPGLLTDAYQPILLLAGSAYFLFIWLFYFFSFIDYYLDTWIITNERIINIEQNGFFSRTISEERLFRVQDVTSEVKGFWPTIWRFGDVFIQTAGEKQRFHFEQVPHPDMVRDTIIRLAEQDREREAGVLKQSEILNQMNE
ncbi:MAG: PH domain-containing protein [Candidatus Falkowbacteria bacterium]